MTLDPTTRMVFAGPEQDAARALAERLMDAGSRGGTVYRTSPVAVVGTTEAVVKALADQGLPPMPASLAGKGTARVWTARSDAGSTVLAIAADDKASLEALMRPLPHYGRQSFLVFQGREAVERGSGLGRQPVAAGGEGRLTGACAYAFFSQPPRSVCCQ